MRRILVGTPTHTGAVDMRYTASLIRTDRLLRSHGIDCVPLFTAYDALVQRARNDIVRVAIETCVDDLLFIDADQQWDPQAALAVLQHPVDCIGLPVIRKIGAERYNVYPPLSPGPSGLVRVSAIGSGFLRLSRKAFTALWEASEPYKSEYSDARMVFDVQVRDGELVGEDIMVCRKLTDLGFDIHIDPAFTVSHVGHKLYEGDFKPVCESILSLERAG